MARSAYRIIGDNENSKVEVSAEEEACRIEFVAESIKYRCCGVDHQGNECTAIMNLVGKDSINRTPYFRECAKLGRHIEYCSHARKNDAYMISHLYNDIAKIDIDRFFEKILSDTECSEKEDCVEFSNNEKKSKKNNNKEKESESVLEQPRRLNDLWHLLRTNRADKELSNAVKCHQVIINEYTNKLYRPTGHLIMSDRMLVQAQLCSEKNMMYLARSMEKQYRWTLEDSYNNSEKAYYILQFFGNLSLFEMARKKIFDKMGGGRYRCLIICDDWKYNNTLFDMHGHTAYTGTIKSPRQLELIRNFDSLSGIFI